MKLTRFVGVALVVVLLALAGTQIISGLRSEERRGEIEMLLEEALAQQAELVRAQQEALRLLRWQVRQNARLAARQRQTQKIVRRLRAFIRRSGLVPPAFAPQGGASTGNNSSSPEPAGPSPPPRGDPDPPRVSPTPPPSPRPSPSPSPSPPRFCVDQVCVDLIQDEGGAR